MIGLRLEIEWTPRESYDLPWNAGELLDAAGNAGDDMLLELLNAMLEMQPGVGADVLASMLREGGSVYTVNSAGNGLERRVSEVAKTAFDAAVAAIPPGTSAAAHLGRAWSELYGLHPDEGNAYDEAVLALEAMICPVVIPNDPKPTLGKAISALRGAPRNFYFALGSGGDPTALLQMLDAIWQTHIRHANVKGPTPKTTPEEAGAAVHLAVSLCHFVTAGSFARR